MYFLSGGKSPVGIGGEKNKLLLKKVKLPGQFRRNDKKQDEIPAPRGTLCKEGAPRLLYFKLNLPERNIAIAMFSYSQLSR